MRLGAEVCEQLEDISNYESARIFCANLGLSSVSIRETNQVPGDKLSTQFLTLRSQISASLPCTPINNEFDQKKNGKVVHYYSGHQIDLFELDFSIEFKLIT